MSTKIQFINHASVLVECGNLGILTDPWYEGDAFHGGWNLLIETPETKVKEILQKTTHIWVSHEHPDHFSVGFFKKNADLIKAHSIKILFQYTQDKRVLGFFKSLKFEVLEMRDRKEYALSDEVKLICIKNGFYDSALLVDYLGEKTLNLNDCEIKTEKEVQAIRRISGEVDYLLTQFSYAAWKGGVAQISWRKKAAAEKLNTVFCQVKHLRPHKVIPFASFIYFSNKTNFYLNDHANQPRDVVDHISSLPSEVVCMKPGDVLSKEETAAISDDAVEYWSHAFNRIKTAELNEHSSVSVSELFNNFAIYSERINRKNSNLTMKILRLISPIKIFMPVRIFMEDINKNVKIDYVKNCIEESDETPQLMMHSGSLNFLLLNTFGFDTLTVNGCFEENKKGDFLLATRSLAVENLNNLGFSIRPSFFLRFNVIKLFLVKLLNVAKNLRS